MNEKNRIKIDLSDSGAVITNIFLEVKGTSNIANIYNGYYKIAEKNVNVHKRLATFVEESPVILRYASSLDNNRIITLDPKSKLTQEKQNKVILIAKESVAYQKCSESVKLPIAASCGDFSPIKNIHAVQGRVVYRRMLGLSANISTNSRKSI